MRLEHESKKGNTYSVQKILRSEKVSQDSFDKAINYTITHNKFNIFKILLSDPNFEPKKDNKIFKLSVRSGRILFVKETLESKKISIEDWEIRLSVKITAQSGYTDILRLLYSDTRFVSDDQFNEYILMVSIMNGNINIVSFLFNRFEFDEGMTNRNVQLSSTTGHIYITKLLLKEKKADPSNVLDPVRSLINKENEYKMIYFLKRSKDLNINILTDVYRMIHLRFLDPLKSNVDLSPNNL